MSPLVGIRMEALETSLLEQPQQELFAGRSRNLAHQIVFIAEPTEQSIGATGGGASSTSARGRSRTGVRVRARNGNGFAGGDKN